MVLNDTLANALSLMQNSEKVGKLDCTISPGSRLIREVLSILKENKYVDVYEAAITDKGSTIQVKLSGKINRCNVIKPRFSVKFNEIEKYEKRFLPAKDFGILIISTPTGLMTHKDVKTKGIGGKLIAFCY